MWGVEGRRGEGRSRRRQMGGYEEDGRGRYRDPEKQRKEGEGAREVVKRGV